MACMLPSCRSTILKMVLWSPLQRRMVRFVFGKLATVQSGLLQDILCKTFVRFNIDGTACSPKRGMGPESGTLSEDLWFTCNNCRRFGNRVDISSNGRW